MACGRDAAHARAGHGPDGSRSHILLRQRREGVACPRSGTDAATYQIASPLYRTRPHSEIEQIGSSGIGKDNFCKNQTACERPRLRVANQILDTILKEKLRAVAPRESSTRSPRGSKLRQYGTHPVRLGG